MTQHSQTTALLCIAALVLSTTAALLLAITLVSLVATPAYEARLLPWGIGFTLLGTGCLALTQCFPSP